MPITHVTVENANLDGAAFDLESITEYKELPRKYDCLPDDGGGSGTDSQDFCQLGCLNEPGFMFIVEPADTINLQFRFPDYVNEDPNSPTYGWLNSEGGQYFIRLEAVGMNGVVLWSGPLFQVSLSFGVYMSDAGPVQNVQVSVELLLRRLPPGTSCWFFRTVVVIARPEFTPVNYFGSWDGDPPYGVQGTVVMNNDPAHFGFFELKPNGWELVGQPEDGDIIYVASTGTFQQYTAGSMVVYTAHGAAAGSAFSFSKGSVTGPFSVTDTIPVLAGSNTQLGGVVLGLRTSPDNSDACTGFIKRVRRWNGSQTSDNAEGGGASTVDGGANWSPDLDDDGPMLPNDARSTRVCWATEDPGTVWLVSQGYQANGINPLLRKSTDYGATWTTKDFDGTADDQEATSVVAYSGLGDLCVGMKSGRIYFSTDGANTWDYIDPIAGFGGYVVVGRMNDDDVLAVGAFTGKYSTNQTRGNANVQPWSAAQSFPSVGFPWRCTDILHQGDKVFVFGVSQDGLTGVLMRSPDSGSTWENVPAASVLGGRADLIGFDTIVATSHSWAGEVGDTATKAGTVYVSTDAGSTWTVLPNQPSGGAEAVSGYTSPGSWAIVPQPGLQEPGEDLPTDSATTMAFRLRRCDEPIVHFKSEASGIDCMGYVHDLGPGTILGTNAQPFQHDFKVQGSLEVEEFPIAREVTKNGRLKNVTLSTKARLRTWGLPQLVARRVQTVLGSADFELDGEKWEVVDGVKKNNEEGSHWYLDTLVSRDDCDTGATCD